MKIEKLEEFRNYYKELERLLIETEEYVAVDEINFKVYSIRFNWLYQSICSEVDVVMKEIAGYVEPLANHENIAKCRGIILNKYKSISNLKVKYGALNKPIIPWESWSKGKNPAWWDTYNNIKHHRVDTDDTSKLSFYKLANLENVLQALAGLYVLEWYLLVEYTLLDYEINDAMVFYGISDENKATEKAKGQIAFSFCKGKMEVEQFKGLNTYFAGYHSFDYNKLCKILRGKI